MKHKKMPSLLCAPIHRLLHYLRERLFSSTPSASFSSPAPVASSTSFATSTSSSSAGPSGKRKRGCWGRHSPCSPASPPAPAPGCGRAQPYPPPLQMQQQQQLFETGFQYSPVTYSQDFGIGHGGVVMDGYCGGGGGGRGREAWGGVVWNQMYLEDTPPSSPDTVSTSRGGWGGSRGGGRDGGGGGVGHVFQAAVTEERARNLSW